MLRPALATALLALAVAAAPSQAKQPDPVQFIDRSVVTVPKVVGRFKLQHAETFPEDILSGVSTGWTTEGTPERFALNVFVYPLGDAAEEKFVEGQANEVEAEIKAVAAKGTYTDIEFGPHTPFLVVRRPSSMEEEADKKHEAFNPTPKDESAKETKADDADPLAAVLAESTPPPNNHGLRESIRFKRDGVAMRSLAYVFHRHLYGFKVRVTVAESDMDQAAFEAIADEAARWLVPQIEVENYGTCGNIEIPASKDGDKDDDGKAMAESLVRGMARIQNSNCAANEGKKKRKPSADSQQLELVFPANTWK